MHPTRFQLTILSNLDVFRASAVGRLVINASGALEASPLHQIEERLRRDIIKGILCIKKPNTLSLDFLFARVDICNGGTVS